MQTTSAQTRSSLSNSIWTDEHPRVSLCSLPPAAPNRMRDIIIFRRGSHSVLYTYSNSPAPFPFETGSRAGNRRTSRYFVYGLRSFSSDVCAPWSRSGDSLDVCCAWPASGRHTTPSTTVASVLRLLLLLSLLVKMFESLTCSTREGEHARP